MGGRREGGGGGGREGGGRREGEGIYILLTRICSIYIYM